MIRISVKHQLRDATKAISQFAARQVPYATALALNAVAADVQKAEQANMRRVLDRPTPFTVKSVAVRKANKRSLVATVFVMDIAARYLEPYEKGGKNMLNSRALIVPEGSGTNQYGNIPQRTLAKLKARSDIFIGKVKTKHGVINGVWQMQATKATRTTVNKKTGAVKVSTIRKGLVRNRPQKLLMRFADAHPVRQRLRYRELARRVVDRQFPRRFDEAMAQALRTAR